MTSPPPRAIVRAFDDREIKRLGKQLLKAAQRADRKLAAQWPRELAPAREEVRSCAQMAVMAVLAAVEPHCIAQALEGVACGAGLVTSQCAVGQPIEIVGDIFREKFIRGFEIGHSARGPWGNA